ncbi:hypothetical protein WJX81_005955 [Elliptochloris bilobata]|uniref:Amino acid transporter n=1 Tax=Elliptochloris bilobata TaxID=381761 RepID=A0AAW1R1X5_9CHLO
MDGDKDGASERAVLLSGAAASSSNFQDVPLGDSPRLVSWTAISRNSAQSIPVPQAAPAVAPSPSRAPLRPLAPPAPLARAPAAPVEPDINMFQVGGRPQLAAPPPALLSQHHLRSLSGGEGGASPPAAPSASAKADGKAEAPGLHSQGSVGPGMHPPRGTEAGRLPSDAAGGVGAKSGSEARPAAERGAAGCCGRDPLLAATLIGVVAGLAGGGVLRAAAGEPWGTDAADLLGFPGELMLRLLKMLVLPLVAGAMVSGVCALRGATGPGVGRVARVTLAYYAATTGAAVALGVALVVLVRPGAGQPLAGEAADGWVAGVGVFNAVIARMVAAVLWVSPLGVASLIAAALVRTCTFASVATALGLWAATVLVGLVLFAIGVLPAVLWAVARRPPLATARAFSRALAIAFGTSSTAAALPAGGCRFGMGWTLAGWLGHAPSDADAQPLLADMPGEEAVSTGAAEPVNGQGGLPGGALMVAGPRAAAPGPQIWMAVGHDLRPLPLLHAPPADAGGQAGAAQHPRAAEAARAWRGERKWVALWAAVAALTLAHTATLVFALGASALSLACAALFAWVAILGAVGAARGLADAASTDAHAGQFAANLRATELAAFLAASLAGLAAGVYMLVLYLFLGKAPLPACAPDQRICAETYNLLLVLMVATVALYGGHAVIAGLVCCKARHARQLLGGCWPGAPEAAACSFF